MRILFTFAYMKFPQLYVISIMGLLLLLTQKIAAQDTTRYVTFMGFVYDDNNKPIYGAVLQNKTRNKAVSTEMNGRFLMVLSPGDVIHVHFIGTKPQTFIIPNTIIENKYVRNIILSTDTFMLKGVMVRAYPTAEEMFTSNINLREVGANVTIKLDHAPEVKKPNPILNPLSSISNAIQKSRMKNGKGKIDAYHQSLMIKEFYKEHSSAVPDSVIQMYTNPE